MRQMSIKLRGKKKKKRDQNNNGYAQGPPLPMPAPNSPYSQQMNQQPLTFRRLTGEGPQFETFAAPPQQQYYGGQQQPQQMMPPPTFNRAATMAAPPVQNLEGTVANERDPFWARRRYTRDDSFPELGEINWDDDEPIKRPVMKQQRSAGSMSVVSDGFQSQASSRYNSQMQPAQSPRYPSQMQPPQQVFSQQPREYSQQVQMREYSTQPQREYSQAQSSTYTPYNPPAYPASSKNKPMDSGKMGSTYLSPTPSNVPVPSMALETSNPSYISRNHKKKRRVKHRGQQQSAETNPVSASPSPKPMDFSSVLASKNHIDTMSRNRQGPPGNLPQASHRQIAGQPQQYRMPSFSPPQQPTSPDFARPYDNISRPFLPSQRDDGPPKPPPKIRSYNRKDG